MPTPDRQRRNLLKKEYILKYLLEHPCKDCGEDDIRVLQFDHLSDKKGDITNLMNRYSLKVLMAEIAKCDVVCCNCHQIRTLTRANSWRLKHYNDRAKNNPNSP